MVIYHHRNLRQVVKIPHTQDSTCPYLTYNVTGQDSEKATFIPYFTSTNNNNEVVDYIQRVMTYMKPDPDLDEISGSCEIQGFDTTAGCLEYSGLQDLEYKENLETWTYGVFEDSRNYFHCKVNGCDSTQVKLAQVDDNGLEKVCVNESSIIPTSSTMNNMASDSLNTQSEDFLPSSLTSIHEPSHLPTTTHALTTTHTPAHSPTTIPVDIGGGDGAAPTIGDTNSTIITAASPTSHSTILIASIVTSVIFGLVIIPVCLCVIIGLVCYCRNNKDNMGFGSYSI